jgi:REP element-mobilizing transposase RayT
VNPNFRSQDKKSPKNRSSIPYNPGLHNLVHEKQAWSEPTVANGPKQEFQGWHQRGYLPHRDRQGLTQFVTIRLHDSLPASRKGEWESLLKLEDNRERRKQLENYLDRGAGECWLAQPEIAKRAEQALRFFDGQRYQLRAWVIMPNHIHVLVDIRGTPLATLMQSWKRFIAREANKLLGREGTFWQREYWDTYMRDTAQAVKAIRYIEANPVKANLVATPKIGHGAARDFGIPTEYLFYPGAPIFNRLWVRKFTVRVKHALSRLQVGAPTVPAARLAHVPSQERRDVSSLDRGCKFGPLQAGTLHSLPSKPFPRRQKQSREDKTKERLSVLKLYRLVAQQRF